MSEPTAGPNPVAAETAEAVAVATLHRLNAQHIRAFVESDTIWYSEHLGKGGVSPDVPRAEGRA